MPLIVRNDRTEEFFLQTQNTKTGVPWSDIFTDDIIDQDDGLQMLKDWQEAATEPQFEYRLIKRTSTVIEEVMAP